MSAAARPPGSPAGRPGPRCLDAGAPAKPGTDGLEHAGPCSSASRDLLELRGPTIARIRPRPRAAVQARRWAGSTALPGRTRRALQPPAGLGGLLPGRPGRANAAGSVPGPGAQRYRIVQPVRRTAAGSAARRDDLQAGPVLRRYAWPLAGQGREPGDMSTWSGHDRGRPRLPLGQHRAAGTWQVLRRRSRRCPVRTGPMVSARSPVGGPGMTPVRAHVQHGLGASRLPGRGSCAGGQRRWTARQR